MSDVLRARRDGPMRAGPTVGVRVGCKEGTLAAIRTFPNSDGPIASATGRSRGPARLADLR